MTRRLHNLMWLPALLPAVFIAVVAAADGPADAGRDVVQWRWSGPPALGAVDPPMVVDIDGEPALAVLGADTVHLINGENGTPIETLHPSDGPRFRDLVAGFKTSPKRTWPLVEDIDGDGQTEVLLPDSDWPVRGWVGFTVRAPR